MKRNLSWILAALMLSFMTVSCSSDDNDVEDPTGPRLENGKVVIGHGASRTEIKYVPANMDELPEWLQEEILEWDKSWYMICLGTWEGQRAYYYWNALISTTNSIGLEDGTFISFTAEEFEEKSGGWDAWTCIFYYCEFDSLADDEENSDE